MAPLIETSRPRPRKPKSSVKALLRPLWSRFRPKKRYTPGTSPLEKLPGELRNRIYEFVLSSGEEYILGRRHPKVPAICCVSTFFRNETLPKWRAENTIVILGWCRKHFIRFEGHAGMKHVHNFHWGMEMIFPRPVFEKKRVRFNLAVYGQDYSISRIMEDDEVSKSGVRIWPDEEARVVMKAKQEEMLQKLEEVLERKFVRYTPRG
ncbi:hypothetical protein LTR37_001488 [Vermiconidia calcicola]|uniref:Uncharacterized protein n=1 Tax=Vermiconidia calcicola TaxID=1690605 RepID=A0ACC3NVW0_9PEZI|nr:hypothetical protein LTR37_001488 [Vermiconidia calcicola]